jgi:hypothetical protein
MPFPFQNQKEDRLLSLPLAEASESVAEGVLPQGKSGWSSDFPEQRHPRPSEGGGGALFLAARDRRTRPKRA